MNIQKEPFNDQLLRILQRIADALDRIERNMPKKTLAEELDERAAKQKKSR